MNKVSLSSIGNYEVENLYTDPKEFIKRLKSSAEEMLPFYKSHLMNGITQGIPRGRVTFFCGFGNTGKALETSAQLPTPEGWRQAGDVKVGDKLFDRLGKPTEVLGVYPQGKIDAHRVTLDDGRKFVVSGEHVMPYITSRGNISSKTLNEMKKDYLREYKIKGKYEKYHAYKLPNNQPVEYTEKELPIDPYALGVLIGDGALTVKYLTISSNEFDVVDKASKRLGLKTPEKSIYNYNWKYKSEDGKLKEIMDNIENLNLNIKSIYRFIPEEYMLGSVEQRMELLKGLMDSDGRTHLSPAKSLAFHYSTNSKKLAKDIKMLAHSLGIGATLSEYDRGDKENIEYVVNLYTQKAIVSSKKHLEKYNQAKKFSKKEDYSYIVDIEQISDREMVCFRVDNNESLFLMNDYVVTHNSSIVAEKVVMSYIVNKEKAIVVLNEEGADDFRQKIILSMLNHETKEKGFNRKHMVNGKLTETDEEQITIAMNKLKELTEGDEAQIKIVFMENYDMDELESLVRYHANRGYSNLLVDTHKMSDKVSQAQRWAQFVEDAKRIYKFTRKEAGGLNLRTVLTLQLADSHIRDRYLTADALAEGKASKNEASIVMMFRPIFSDEYTGGRHELKCHKWRKKTEDEKILNPKDTKKYIKEEFTLDKGKVYYLLFTPKNRFGSTNENGQEVLVIEPNFNFNSFIEVGWTYVDKDFS